MNGFMERLLDIRLGERQRAWLMFTYIFLLIASLMIVKPVRNSLFLVTFGAERLPYLFVVVAAFAALITWLYTRFTRFVHLNRLTLSTILISVLSLFVFWLLLRLDYQGNWFLWAFYVWVSIFGLITATQFWLLANYVFDAREARRLFGFVGAGGISGGIFGGYFTNWLAPLVTTHNLLLFCMAFLLVCIPVFLALWRRGAKKSYRRSMRMRRSRSPVSPAESPVKLVLASRYLLYIAGIIGISVIVATLVDYQFNAVASAVIEQEDELTAFFGFWLSTLSVISLGIQLVLTGRVMKHLGVIRSLFFLPTGILVGSLGVLVSPGLGSAILVKVSDGSFKHSINKAGVELLSLPIPARVKNRVKSLLDVFIDNLATGIAGLLLIVLTASLGLSVRGISLVVMGLIVMWIFCIIRVRGEYVNAFRSALEKRSIEMEKLSLDLQNASLFESVVRVLEGDNERQILYVLGLLEGLHNRKLAPHLEKLLEHPSPEVRARILELARRYPDLDLTDEARRMVDDERESLRIAAIKYLCDRSEDKLSVLKMYQEHHDYRVRASALMCIADAWKQHESVREELDLRSRLERTLSRENLGKFDDRQQTFIKVNAARIIGTAGNSELYPWLHQLLDDDSTDVLASAITSAGKTREPEFTGKLIRHLKTRNVRRSARHALAEFGEDVLDELMDNLHDPSVDRRIRLAIPRVISSIGTKRSLELLMESLDFQDMPIRHEVIRALNRLRSAHPDLKPDRAEIDRWITTEVTRYCETAAVLRSFRSSVDGGPHCREADAGSDRPANADRAARLLESALRERLLGDLERIFRLLGLRFSPGDIYHAYLGITSGRNDLKADAVEFLDNVLGSEMKRSIIPIVEQDPLELPAENIRRVLGRDGFPFEESVLYLLSGPDRWLKACTLYLVADRRWSRYVDTVRELDGSDDPVVAETAAFCLERLTSDR